MLENRYIKDTGVKDEAAYTPYLNGSKLQKTPEKPNQNYFTTKTIKIKQLCYTKSLSNLLTVQLLLRE